MATDANTAQSQLSCSIDQGVFQLTGQLDRYTVVNLDKEVKLKRISDEQIVIDLADVSKVDTAGLAWILKVKASADQAGQHVLLREAPEQLMVLAKLSGVDSLLV